jgi:glycosidase
MRQARWTSIGTALALAACTGHAPPTPAPPPPASTDGVPADAWWNGAVFYEVFVRSFKDSNGDGIGDLAGLLEKLDYLNDGDPSTDADLGVDAIWLMPVFESPSYHGYDVVDYEAVERDYGTSADLEALLAAAHARGMKVIVDLVLNHTSDEHPWFVESAASPSSPRRDWYVWRGASPRWTQPWNAQGETWHARKGAYYYGLFWSGMPDLNYRTAAVRAEAKRIAAHWLRRGVDGFRLDAVRHLYETGPGGGQSDAPETFAFLRDLAAHVRAERTDAVLVGEVWADTATIAPYYGSTAAVPGGDVLPLLFDFPLAEAIASGVRAGDAAAIAAKLGEVARTYPRGAADAPFLGNHDQVRLATRLEDDAARLRLAASILLTLPGSPFLYYGEEIGMQNGPGGSDERKRTPMAWDRSAGGGFTTGKPWCDLAPGRSTANVAAQSGDPGSLLSRHRALVRVRRASAALRRGALSLFPGAPGGARVLVFARSVEGETVLVAHNLAGEAATAGPVAAGGSAAEPLLADPGAAATAGPGGWTVALPARGSAVWRIR